MGWIDHDPSECRHPDLPDPQEADKGRVWKCDDCRKRLRVLPRPKDGHGYDIRTGQPLHPADTVCWFLLI